MLRNNPASTASQSLSTHVQNASAVISQAIKAVVNWPIDNAKLAWYQEEYVFTELYERARENNIAWVRTAPSFMASWSRDYIPAGVYVITGWDNIMAVGDYGEKNQDPKARFFFKYLDQLVGRSNLLSTTLRQGGQEKALFREQMINHSAKPSAANVENLNHADVMPPLDYVAHVARRRIKSTLAAWDSSLSFQDQITHLGANMVGECVLGIPELPLSYVPEIRKVGEVLLEGGQNARHLQECAKFLKQLNTEVCSKHLKHIFETDKFLLRDYVLELRRDDEDTAEEKLADVRAAVAVMESAEGIVPGIDPSDIEIEEQEAIKETAAKKIEQVIEELVKRSVVSMYSVEGNLSTTIMGAIAAVNEDEDIRNQIIKEWEDYRQANAIIDEDDLSVDQLRRELPYLDAVYWEAMRFMAMAAVVPRKTSLPMELKIKDSKGVAHHYSIPPHSILFTPLRAMHLDPKIWPNPRTFDPSRFDLRLATKDPRENTPQRQSFASDDDFSQANLQHALEIADYEEAAKQHKAKITENRKRIKPFSVGLRACPGQFGFVEIIVKLVLLETVKHNFIFDKKIEVIPTHSHKTTWNETYKAKLEKANPTNQLGMRP